VALNFLKKIASPHLNKFGTETSKFEEKKSSTQKKIDGGNPIQS
jgi:hypothetical protein